MNRVKRACGLSLSRWGRAPWSSLPRAAGAGRAALAAVLLIAPGMDVATGQPSGIFQAAETSAPTPRAGILPTAPAADAITLRRRLVSIDFTQLSPPVDGAAGVTAPAASTGTLGLNLFDDVSFTGVVERVAPTFSGGYSLSGRLAEVELGTVTLVVNGETVAGSVWTPEGTYRIRPAGGGLHAISEIDPSRLPPPGEPLELRPERNRTPPAVERGDSPPAR